MFNKQKPKIFVVKSFATQEEVEALKEHLVEIGFTHFVITRMQVEMIKE